MDGALHTASATTTATLNDDMEADIIHMDSGQQQPSLHKKSFAHRMGITGKMAILVGFLTLLSVGVLAIVAWIDSSTLLEHQLQQRLDTIALLQSRQLANFFINLAENTQLVYNRVLIQTYLRQIHNTDIPLTTLQLQNGTADLASAILSLTDVVAATIYPINSNIPIFQVNNTPIDYAIYSRLKPSTSSGNASIQYVNNNTTPIPGLQVIPPSSSDNIPNNGYLWSVSAYILDNHNQDVNSPPIGFITIILGSAGLFQIITDTSGLGQTGQLLVAHHYNATYYRFVVPPLYGSVNFDQPMPLDGFRAMKLALSNQSGTLDGTSFDDNPVLAAYQPVGFGEWGLVAEMSISEIYSPISNLRIIIIVATLGTLLFALVSTVLFSRVFTAPINQLVKVSNAFREGDLQARAPPQKSAKWWPDQLSELQIVFNSMADRIGRQYIWLEQTVLERTQELREASRAADAANAAKSRFLANMSHEIRTPLNAIVNISRLCLEDEEGVQGDSRQLLQLLRASGDHLLTLVDAVLETSRIEAGMAEPASRPFRLRRIVNQLRSMFYVTTKQKGIEFTCNVDAAVPDNLRGDPQWLMQVLVNLVGNAVKFTSEGGVTVNIRITEWSRPPPESNIETTPTAAFSLPPDDSSNKTVAAPSPTAVTPVVTPATVPGKETVTLEFSISDTGIGIPPDRQHLLFKSFSQLDSTHSRKFGGSGLGLAISKQLVELMGGKMWLESTDGDEKDEVKGRDGEDGDRGGTTQTPIPDSVLISIPMSNPPRTQAQTQTHTPTPTPTHSQTSTLTPTVTPTMTHSQTSTLIPTPTHSQTYSQTQTPTPTPTPTHSQTQAQTQALAQSLMRSQVRIQTPPPTPSQKPKQGATFFFRVPFATVADNELKRQESEERMMAAKSEPDRHLRILMAEDNNINQEIARRILTKMGHTVVLAGNGFEAIAEFQKSVDVAKDGMENQEGDGVNERFDVILMDVQMPELDGVAATERIRAYEIEHSLTPIPIIALTAHALSSDQEVCLRAGMDGFVTKPIDVSTLKATLRDVMADAVDSAKYVQPIDIREHGNSKVQEVNGAGE